MGIDDKILAEITRFKKINKYISEQAVDPTAAPSRPNSSGRPSSSPSRSGGSPSRPSSGRCPNSTSTTS